MEEQRGRNRYARSSYRSLFLRLQCSNRLFCSGKAAARRSWQYSSLSQLPLPPFARLPSPLPACTASTGATGTTPSPASCPPLSSDSSWGRSSGRSVTLGSVTLESVTVGSVTIGISLPWLLAGQSPEAYRIWVNHIFACNTSVAQS